MCLCLDLNRTKKEDVLLTEDDPEALHAGAAEVLLPVPVVLLPVVDYQDPAENQGAQRHHERGHRSEPEGLRTNIGYYA